MRRGTDLLVDVQDLAVAADVERPPRRQLAFARDPVGARDLSARIAENRVIDAKVLGEPLVRFRCVDTCREIRDIETANLVAALTERFALRRSTTCEGFREPREDDDLSPAVVGQAVRPPVGAGQDEVRGLISRLECGTRARRRTLEG
jgi:hypothetical protein